MSCTKALTPSTNEAPTTDAPPAEFRSLGPNSKTRVRVRLGEHEPPSASHLRLPHASSPPGCSAVLRISERRPAHPVPSCSRSRDFPSWVGKPRGVTRPGSTCARELSLRRRSPSRSSHANSSGWAASLTARSSGTTRAARLGTWGPSGAGPLLSRLPRNGETPP